MKIKKILALSGCLLAVVVSGIFVYAGQQERENTKVLNVDGEQYVEFVQMYGRDYFLAYFEGNGVKAPMRLFPPVPDYSNCNMIQTDDPRHRLFFFINHLRELELNTFEEEATALIELVKENKDKVYYILSIDLSNAIIHHKIDTSETFEEFFYNEFFIIVERDMQAVSQGLQRSPIDSLMRVPSFAQPGAHHVLDYERDR